MPLLSNCLVSSPLFIAQHSATTDRDNALTVTFDIREPQGFGFSDEGIHLGRLASGKLA